MNAPRRPRLSADRVGTRHVLVLVVVTFVLGIGADLALGASRPGLIAGIGFLGCVAMIYGAKWLGKALLSRPESYWAETDQPEVHDEALDDAGGALADPHGEAERH